MEPIGASLGGASADKASPRNDAAAWIASPSYPTRLGADIAAGDGIGHHGDAVAGERDPSIAALRRDPVSRLVIDLDKTRPVDEAAAGEPVQILGGRPRLAMHPNDAPTTPISLHDHPVQPRGPVSQHA